MCVSCVSLRAGVDVDVDVDLVEVVVRAVVLVVAVGGETVEAVDSVEMTRAADAIAACCSPNPRSTGNTFPARKKAAIAGFWKQYSLAHIPQRPR